jgi:ribosomal protein S18
LEKNGFFVKYVHPNTVFVSWHTWVPSYVRNEIKKKLGVSLDEKGNIIEKKTTEEMDNSNPDTQMFITDREKITQSNTSSNSSQKQYTPIKNYKPTGNLVYSPDVLEKLEKKISFNI